tara:strand:- start:1033 stop:1290 length:258 start_codon:yes stop_codon:yes gene_type:complete
MINEWHASWVTNPFIVTFSAVIMLIVVGISFYCLEHLKREYEKDREGFRKNFEEEREFSDQAMDAYYDLKEKAEQQGFTINYKGE